jgi:hypothetical protein
MNENKNQQEPTMRDNKANLYLTVEENRLPAPVTIVYINQTRDICQKLLTNDQPSALSKTDWVMKCIFIVF